jgi:two-component system chemotaxis sensor kinase CheA
MDPLSFLNYLASLGEIIALTTLADTMPAAAEMDPECCYLGFEIDFQTRASKAQIEQRLRIRPRRVPALHPAAALEDQ